MEIASCCLNVSPQSSCVGNITTDSYHWCYLKGGLWKAIGSWWGHKGLCRKRALHSMAVSSHRALCRVTVEQAPPPPPQVPSRCWRHAPGIHGLQNSQPSKYFLRYFVITTEDWLRQPVECQAYSTLHVWEAFTPAIQGNSGILTV